MSSCEEGYRQTYENDRYLAAIRIWSIEEFDDNYAADVWILPETRVEKSVAEMIE
jgi:hypothetical protein